MILSNVTIAGYDHPLHIRIAGEKIAEVSSAGVAGGGPRLELGGCIAFPGLINSHEHLDFNNFPLLGNRIYKNYTEWGADIHANNKETINAVLKIPRDLRIQWGVYKNLLNGITTVVNHGEKLPVGDDLIRIHQGVQSLHSLTGEKSWRYKLNFRSSKEPVAIHIGEGTDKIAAAEIDTIMKWNLFQRKVVGIHGVAMKAEQASAFHALIWCPDSNYFLLGKTAPVQQLKNRTELLFGTDSTLTAHWNIWEHLRLAREQEMVTDAELFGMLTRTPAEIWDLKDRGSLAEGRQSDIIIARPGAGADGWDAFYGLNPENILLVLCKGKVQLFDQSLYAQLVREGFSPNGFHTIRLNGADKYIRGDLPSLIRQILSYYPAAQFPVTIS